MRRIVEIVKKSYVSTKNNQLQISQNGELVGCVPLEDLGVLILNDPSCLITQQAIVASQQENVAIVFCDQKRNPISTLLPDTTGNSLHTKVLRDQISAKESTKNRLWQSIVREKLRNQANLLKKLDRNYLYVSRLIPKVKSGDSANLEAQAARHYWKQLFGPDFLRRVDTPINAHLNYGYAIVRACIARSIAATGLHPAIGLNHRNQYNPLVLADDLIEPFRPWVDEIVYEITNTHGELELNQSNKRKLLQILETKVFRNDERLPLMTAFERLAADLKKALSKNEKSINWFQRL